MKKKLIFSFLVACIFACTSGAALIPKLSIDIPSTIDYAGYDDSETDRAYTLALEYRLMFSRYFGAGAGFEYGFERRNIDLRDNNFNFAPAYVTLLYYPVSVRGLVNPYIKFNFGYNVLFNMQNSDSASAGLYWAGGGGLELYKVLVFEIMGSSYYGSFKRAGESTDVNYKKISFNVGYRFFI